MSRLVTSTRWQIAVLVVWLFILVAAFPAAMGINQKLDATAVMPGTESHAVESALQQRFSSPFTKIALLRMSGAVSPRTDEGRRALRLTAESIQQVAGVRGVMSYLDRDDGLFIGEDGSSILVVGLSPDQATGASLLVALQASTARVYDQLHDTFPQISFGWTGEASVNADMRRLSAASTRAAEIRVLPVTLLLLCLAFRSVLSALLPLLCGALTIVVALGLLAAVNEYWPTSIIVVSIISMVGLGLSIDYALLMVSRFRENLVSGLARGAAVSEAAGHAGETIVVSGSAVCVGFGAMLCVPINEVRSIGTGGLIVTAVSVLVAVTILPCALVRQGSWTNARALARDPNKSRGGYWRGWAQWVSRRPVLVLIAAGVPLLLIAAQALHLRIDLPRGRWLPESAPSVRILHGIDAVARGNFGQIIDIVLELPAGTSIRDEAGWRAAAQLARHFARDARMQHVWSITTVVVKPMSGPEILSEIPEAVRARLVTPDGRGVLLQLLPRRDLAATDAAALVREIRAQSAQQLTGIAGARIDVGGVPAFNVDYQDTIGGSLLLLAAIVVGATLVVLAIAFRSVLIPVKAVALNLLSVATSLGAVTLVFQSEAGSRLLGLPRALDGGFPIVPILVFGIVFGLSMDYEVFLMSRIAAARRAGLGDSAALVEGIGGMGRVITYAAAIMIAIFCGFVFGEFVLIKMLGFALGVAVLVDATVIRLALGPALFQLAGRWNWWPGDQDGSRRGTRQQ